MYRAELQKLEGVWMGTERSSDTAAGPTEATGRWEFHTVFDGKFLLCDYIQSGKDRPTSVAHGVFCKDEETNDALTVTWFRSPKSTGAQQTHGIAEGDKLVFVETVAKVSLRTVYQVALNRLTVITERSVGGNEWTQIFEGSYRRPRG